MVDITELVLVERSGPGQGATAPPLSAVSEDGSCRPSARVKAVIRDLLATLEQRGVRYCHWKSNIRLADALSGDDDVDLLVHRADATAFEESLLAHGFKLTRSRDGIDHPGVFHALGLDAASGEIVHVHAYAQIVTGDSLVKNYRLSVEDALLDGTRLIDGVRVPSAEAELVLFGIRMALKHVSPIEIAMANRGYPGVIRELEWLYAAADERRAVRLCAELFPEIEPDLLRRLLDAVGPRGSLLQRIALGWKVSARLRDRRRLGWAAASMSRIWRVIVLLLGRLRRRKTLALRSGGMIIAFVGPKATGKSTLTRALGERLGRHLDVTHIHAGMPPASLLSFLPRMLTPLARIVFHKERPSEYEKAERRRQKTYSLVYVLRMMLAAYDRRKLLLKALRAATAGSIVISDRYPSDIAGAIDSSCFDDEAVARCSSTLKRRLMLIERSLYRGLPKPDFVIRLTAPIEATLARDAQRVKEGAPDAAALRRRWELEMQAYVNGERVAHIDTSRPLDETISTVMQVAWKAM